MVVLPAALAARVRELTRSSERPRRGRAFRRQLSELLGRQRHTRRCGWQQLAVQEAFSCSPACLAKVGRQWGGTCRGATPADAAGNRGPARWPPASLEDLLIVSRASLRQQMCVGVLYACINVGEAPGRHMPDHRCECCFHMCLCMP